MKSAVASLWAINDEATVKLMTEFYSQISQTELTKAQALQQAQLKLIGQADYNHPAYWAPFLLVGNWL